MGYWCNALGFVRFVYCPSATEALHAPRPQHTTTRSLCINNSWDILYVHFGKQGQPVGIVYVHHGLLQRAHLFLKHHKIDTPYYYILPPEVVVITTCGGTSDNIVAIVTTLDFQWYLARDGTFSSSKFTYFLPSLLLCFVPCRATMNLLIYADTL